jgi:predicted unusual protein kinase regulating ubiquinone biosynthesis (AarF/ABC1/UbiB family)
MYFISTCITFLQELALLYKLHKVITTITILCNSQPLNIDDDDTSLPNRDITNSLILLQHCAYLRTLLLEGGSIYIKLAQWLLSNISYNSVYSVVYEQLEDLFDNCPSQTLEQSAIVYAAATGHQLSDDYDVASIRVIGSGSIGTVYYAVPLNTTPLATPVAIKIKHPQINEELEQKRTVIQCLQSMQQFSIFRRWFNMNCIDLDSFLANIYSQADFTIEAANMARMHTNFANNPSIVIPRVLWSSRDVLITEYVPTIELKEIAAGEQYLVACNLICMIYQMCLVDNFIHGDLHCKNWKLLAPLAPLDPLAPLAPLDPQSSGAMGERSHPQ